MTNVNSIIKNKGNALFTVISDGVSWTPWMNHVQQIFECDLLDVKQNFKIAAIRK